MVAHLVLREGGMAYQLEIPRVEGRGERRVRRGGGMEGLREEGRGRAFRWGGWAACRARMGEVRRRTRGRRGGGRAWGLRLIGLRRRRKR